MPIKKKKGKSSKLARMSDEERARYLQHRLEVELEAKRRKQQLIAVFTKNKLKREEAFSRLNTAKINEQWRFILRQKKCVELQGEIVFLRENFNRVLKAKDDAIHRLYNELLTAELDHRRMQDAHMEAIDHFIMKSKQRLNFPRKIYLNMISDIEKGDVNSYFKLKDELQRAIDHLETINYGQEKCLENTLMETRTRNAISITKVEFMKKETAEEMQMKIGKEMNILWQTLDKILTDYELSTASQKKEYEYLKEKEDGIRAETANYPQTLARRQNEIEFWRNRLHNFTEEANATIADLKDESERCTKRVWKLRQDSKIVKTLDAINLKRLSVLSSKALKELNATVEKGSQLRKLTKLCLELEPEWLTLKKYQLQGSEPEQHISSNDNERFIDKTEKFWKLFNYVKVENMCMKKEQTDLRNENYQLRRALQNYLTTVKRVPTIRRPSTSVCERLNAY